MTARARHPRDRGAVAMEVVIMLPLLVLIVFAMVEVGFAWRDSRTLSNGTRAAARIASNLGDERLADYQALDTLAASINRIDDGNIDMVVIYRATAADGGVPSSCTAAGGTSVNGLCNAYTATQIASMVPGDFVGTSSCSGASPDTAWCPLDRETEQLTGPDFLGVYVQVTRTPTTGIFPGGDLTISDSTVMRLEPR